MVNADQKFKAEVLIKDEFIEAVGPNLEVSPEEANAIAYSRACRFLHCCSLLF